MEAEHGADKAGELDRPATELDRGTAKLDEREQALARREAEFARGQWLAAERDRIADERDRIANHREQMADEREIRADEREGAWLRSVNASDLSAPKTRRSVGGPTLGANRRTSGVRWPNANVVVPMTNPRTLIPT